MKMPFADSAFKISVKQYHHIDETDEKEYYHIPFTRRHLIGNQRFSISGQPMLYLSSSVFAVARELETDSADLAIAAFLQKPKERATSKLFSFRNFYNDVIENSLPAILSGSKISYYNERFQPSGWTFETDIKHAVLMQLCTFPTERKGSFIPEYVLPQMLTTALLEHEYAGIVFPSTKDCTSLSGHHRFSTHHLNLGLFVSYKAGADYDDDLFEKFTVFTPEDRTESSIDVETILGAIQSIKESKRSPAYLIHLINLELYLEYMINSKLSGIDYFETEAGRRELMLYYRILEHI